MSHILLVEDDHMQSEATRTFLELYGYHIAEAGDAEEALDLARKKRFDVIITDLGLPGAGGEELMRRLGEAGVRVPVIAISGNKPARDLPFAAYLSKPCLPQKLLDAIERAMKATE